LRIFLGADFAVDDQLPQPEVEVVVVDCEDADFEHDVVEAAVLATDVQAICGTGGNDF